MTLLPLVALRTRCAAASLVLLAIAVLLSCGEDSDGATTAPTIAPARASYADLLRWMPPSEERPAVFFFSYAMLRDKSGTPLPDDPLDPDAVQQYLNAIFRSDEDVRGVPFFNSRIDNWRRYADNTIPYLLLSPAHIDLAMFVDEPTSETYVAAGRFDPAGADPLLRACTGCPLSTDVRTRAGLSYYAWGNDAEAQSLRDSYGPPAFDWLGRPGRIHLTESLLIDTLTDERMEALLDAGTGAAPSLADREDFVLVSRALEDAGAYAAHVIQETYGPAYRDFDLQVMHDFGRGPDTLDAWYPAPGTPVLRPYQLVGAGSGSAGEDQPYIVFVLYHSTEDAAAANVELLRLRIQQTSSALTGDSWTDRFTNVDITAQGKLLIARLDGEYSYGFIYNGDPLLLHE